MRQFSRLPMVPAAFFDRDGVLNDDAGYVFRREDFRWRPGAIDAIRMLNEHGYYVFVVTNQSGVARGFFGEQDVRNLHDWIAQELSRHNARIDAFYYCPHHPDGAIPEYRIVCDCRKPLAGMLERAMREWPVLRERSFLIGDRESDVQAAHAARIKGYMLKNDEDLRDAVASLIE